MEDSELWFGVLDAGKKSSPVVLDPRLDTRDPKTIYLFNFSRGEILEYKREIVEHKLRELGAQESAGRDDLNRAYAEARRTFRPRGTQVLNIPDRPAPSRRARREETEQLPAEDTEVGDDIAANIEESQWDVDDS